MIDPPVIVVTRDPDTSNEYIIFDQQGVAPVTIDVDYGGMNLDDKDEFEEWASSHLEQATELINSSSFNAVQAGSHLASLVLEARVNYGHS